MNLKKSETSLPVDRICGLRPEVWLSVGSGFAREDVKSLVLSRGQGFTGDAILTLQEICIKVTGIAKDRILSSPSRQEIIRTLLSESRISDRMPELKRLKRQRGFIRRLDSALQTGRMTFAHAFEEEVYHERLSQTLGENPLKLELRALTQAYETWLEAGSWVDPPLLIRSAIRILREGWPRLVSKPKEIWVLTVQNPESLEKEFWDVVAHHLDVRWKQTLFENIEQAPFCEWQKWHTLDDAAEFFADSMVESASHSGWNEHSILIPDIPSIRRSLRRALALRNIPMADPRDPTQLRWDESVKWAIKPLQVVGKRYERQDVISWLRGESSLGEPGDEFSDWVHEINSRGIRSGIQSYWGGLLSNAHQKLLNLETVFGGKKTCLELAQCHLDYLKMKLVSKSAEFWLISFFEHTWKVFAGDMERIGLSQKKAPVLFWLERIQARLSEASPPIEQVKPSEGIKIYRLQQAPVSFSKRVWIFGLPQSWLKGEGSGGYWFSERDREILASEFAVRSSVQVHQERIHILASWIRSAEQVTFLDSQYDSGGREQESILPAIKELEMSLGFPFPAEPQERGSHSRFIQSYRAMRPFQPQKVQLPPIAPGVGGAVPELTATTLDRYSRCPFQALAFHRWKVRDVREPSAELWPDVRGNILHEAVRLLLSSVGVGDGIMQFRLLPGDALEQAWRSKRPKGLLKSERVEKYIKSRLVVILEAFCEKEREYFMRSGARPVHLEDLNVRFEGPDFAVLGQPDRVDSHQEGLFVIDYKSSGSIPHGTEMLEEGYRLQLPFYALALSKQRPEPVLGVQFVELDRKAGRKSGIFFKEFNGKEKGKLTQVRSNSKSLIELSPDQAWKVFEDHLVQDAQAFVRGKFNALPKTSNRSKECARCSVADLCGNRRVLNPEVEGEA